MGTSEREKEDEKIRGEKSEMKGRPFRSLHPSLLGTTVRHNRWRALQAITNTIFARKRPETRRVTETKYAASKLISQINRWRGRAGVRGLLLTVQTSPKLQP